MNHNNRRRGQGTTGVIMAGWVSGDTQAFLPGWVMGVTHMAVLSKPGTGLDGHSFPCKI
jgi:hypothetical protein